MNIQSKLMGIFLVLAILVLTIGIAGLYGLNRIVARSNDISNHQVPVTRSISELLIALSGAEHAVEGIFDSKAYSELEQITDNEALLRGAMLRFDMYMAALTWGSESKEFAGSGGSINAHEWDRSGLRGVLIVPALPKNQLKDVHNASVTFSGYADSIARAVNSHKKSLRLHEQGRAREAEAVQREAEESSVQASNFAKETASALQLIADTANTNIAKDTAAIGSAQRGQVIILVLITLLGSVTTFIVGIYFTYIIIVRPLVSLRTVADAFGSGDFSKRTHTTTTTMRDEIGALGISFNTMADKLQNMYQSLEQKVIARTHDLDAKVTELEQQREELARMNKLMVGRELKMAELKKELQTLRDQKT